MKGGNYKVSIEDIKKRTKCKFCKKIGHWDRECPDRKKYQGKGGSTKGPSPSGSAPSTVHYIHEDVRDDEVHMCFHFETNAVEAGGGAGDQGQETASTDGDIHAGSWCAGSQATGSATRAIPPGYGIVDTGCQRMVIGFKTLQDLLPCLPSGLQVTFTPSRLRFRSIGGITESFMVANVPTSLGPRGAVLRPAVLSDRDGENTPLPLSLSLLRKCGATPELDQNSVCLQLCGRRIELATSPAGQLLVPICQFNDAMKRSLLSQISAGISNGEFQLFSIQLNPRVPAIRDAGLDTPPPEAHSNHGVRGRTNGGRADDEAVVPSGHPLLPRAGGAE